MAETMLGDADVEDKTRKLKGWVAGEHRPDDQTIYDWWQLSLKKRVVGYHCEAIGYDLFKISAFLDKLIIDFIKNPYLEFDSVFIFDSFHALIGIILSFREPPELSGGVCLIYFFYSSVYLGCRVLSHLQGCFQMYPCSRLIDLLYG